MPTPSAATVPVSGWASDPTVTRTIEALAADTPAALKAIDTTARGKARAVVSVIPRNPPVLQQVVLRPLRHRVVQGSVVAA
jgi:hypothetical protein